MNRENRPVLFGARVPTFLYSGHGIRHLQLFRPIQNIKGGSMKHGPQITCPCRKPGIISSGIPLSVIFLWGLWKERKKVKKRLYGPHTIPTFHLSTLFQTLEDAKFHSMLVWQCSLTCCHCDSGLCGGLIWSSSGQHILNSRPNQHYFGTIF